MVRILDSSGNEIKTDSTVGEEALKRLESPEKTEVGETAEACTHKYMDELQKCAVDGLDNGNYTEDFYVVVLRKRERTMKNVFRNYYFHRQTRPEPGWDMDLWKVTQKGDLLYCWSLPDMQTGHDMLQYPDHFSEEAPELMQFVWMFFQDLLE